MKTLEPLNATTFFCDKCGIFPADSCTNYHNEWTRPGSNKRALVISGILFIAALVFCVGQVWK